MRNIFFSHYLSGEPRVQANRMIMTNFMMRKTL